MNDIAYEGYTASLELDYEQNCIVGRVNGIPDVITFQANTPLEAKEQFVQAIKDYREDCERTGRIPKTSCSGNIQFRVSPELHARALVASKEFDSFNKFGEALLQKAL